MNVFRWEPLIRASCFAGVLLLMALWEALAPRRRLTANKRPRWASNLGLTALNGLAVHFLVPLGAVGTALLAEERGWTLGRSNDEDGVALAIESALTGGPGRASRPTAFLEEPVVVS